jgi:hypothetical protein
MHSLTLNPVQIKILALMAVEDAVEFLAMDYPGTLDPIRRGTNPRERELRILQDLGRIQLQCSLVRRTQLERISDQLSGLTALKKDIDASWPERWKAFTEDLDRIHARNRSAGQAKRPAEWFMTRIENGNVVLETAQLSPKADASEFVGAVSRMLANYRDVEVDQLDPSDRLALLYAYSLVERGTVPNPLIHPIRTDVLREYPTYLALADPGRGHLQTTVYDNNMLQGTIVHVETIDRQGNSDRGAVEAYRIPSIRDVARIRVHIGDVTPVSVFVGRLVFEGWNPEESNSKTFQQSLLKAAHTVGAACSSMFYLGVAECKIGMDGLTSSQAIGVMKAIVGNVIRDKARQRLSAAFNINTKVVDDRAQHSASKVVEDAVGIARLAVTLTSLGGFDKVTLDGAIDGKSVPFLTQMQPRDLIQFVHEAHEKGLETYISAGMDASNIGDATSIGVGGVGMGIRLHETNAIGEITHIKRSDVLDVLRNRDLAKNTTIGKAAALLAKLDWLSNLHAIEATMLDKKSDLFAQIGTYFSAKSQGREAVETVEKRLLRLVDELTPSIAQEVESVQGGGVRGPGEEFDPIFAIAHAKVTSDKLQGNATDEELLYYLGRRDVDSLKSLMGYQ